MTHPDPRHKLISELKSTAQEFREQSIEFQGLEREFALNQDKLFNEYKRSSSIRHPGDKGAVREEILREFLSEKGYLPLKYGVSKSSVRVVSQTGHQTEQIDIAIYDSFNSPKLVSYSSLSFLAIEAVYGVIQVKSKLSSKDDVNKGLKNIASFKKLKGAEERFGILFAYECSLQWTTLAKTIEEFMIENPSSIWPNFVVVLNQGLIIPCEEGLVPNGLRYHYFRNSDIKNISKPKATGIPNIGNTLLIFYLYLMELLEVANVKTVDLYQYVRLPFTSSERAYCFTYGEVEEIGDCPKHGRYFRKISHEAINTIIEVCFKSKPTDLSTIFNIAMASDDTTSSEDVPQSNQVYIYNPENLSLKDILFLPGFSSWQFYSLTIDGKQCIIPKYYSFRDKLIHECPKCNYPATL
ncbi:hypothetical protein H6F78_22385 [Coleofasciculus sp. FACHB-64]|uniref:DUF6602 domain-containing protein n=1 Tax=Cyanophyceae TaxID=3028117 RepID=UPI001687750A|nr:MULTISPECIES: DUF6602 domain-containing protein [unclassified Coleofasciculus]MBD1840240.1 hypothetical protein [Coleofasciculus sp. FACHB-501]MBD2048310.1 hypothetical protein [Coleofasciculus sp. FACHB-64]MBD2087520.1 hypothetical protein [Coleofasciculus sp. FACHB-542]